MKKLIAVILIGVCLTGCANNTVQIAEAENECAEEPTEVVDTDSEEIEKAIDEYNEVYMQFVVEQYRENYPVALFGGRTYNEMAELCIRNCSGLVEEESTLIDTSDLYGDFISYSCDESLNDELQSYINLVPNGVLDAVKGIGYHVELVEDPGKEFGYSNVCGMTKRSEKRILIQAKESKFRRAVVHEIGHSFDDYWGMISTSAEFKEIYEAEKESFVVTGFISDGHYKTNTQEYFAEAFQMYIYDASTLEGSAPRTYEFMLNCISGVVPTP